MKFCNQCSSLKEDSDFSKRGTKLQSLCKECAKKRYKVHYQKNPEYYSSKNAKTKQKLVDWFKEYKLTLKCSHCEESHPWCLDFHHLDPSTKEGSVSSILLKKLSKSAVLKEIDKCIVLCSNCHRKLHYEENLAREVGFEPTKMTGSKPVALDQLGDSPTV